MVTDDSLYRKAEKDIEAFWAEQAEAVDWFRKWDRVRQWEPPWVKWFLGGKLNLSYNCIDRHVNSPRRNKAALIWEGEPGDERVLTYNDLYREVNKFANVLKELGVKRGDRVAIYMPMIPELPIAMLACTRIGAPHTIVFGGFSPESLRDRILDADAKIVITADGGWRRGSVVHLKQNVDEALRECPAVSNVVMVRRVGEAANANFQQGRDHWWHDLMEKAPLHCAPEQMDAEDPLYILYTSGTT
ncbi:MAG: AMP-binding protein, partial [Acidobacteria bacterium]|nr:AMP-binding protein [Acidobacteriota bacterium]